MQNDRLNNRITVLRLTLDCLRPEETAVHLGITSGSVRRIIRHNPDVHGWSRGPNGRINAQ